MDRPFFSVLITSYNRAQEAARCVRSCSEQSFGEFEIVLVDDGSTDDTVAELEALREPRLRIVRHHRNRGISHARATAVDNAEGEWFVVVDSDWELLPRTLERLRELIGSRPADVHVIRTRLRRSDGRVEPEVMPATAITGYEERLRWLDIVLSAGASTDAGHCMHRSIFARTNYYKDRRGAMEGLWELDLARSEPSLWVDEILGLQHTDADNSYTRDVSPRRLIPGLLAQAPDMQWMYETMLLEHGEAMSLYAPFLRWGLPGGAASEAFLAGDRRAGLRHTWESVHHDPFRGRVWATLALGLLSPRALAYSKLARRHLQQLAGRELRSRRPRS